MLLLAVLLAVLPWTLSAFAASSAPDPQNDVLSCTGECSLYDQDLASISLAISGPDLLITVSQYGSGGNGSFQKASKLYWPQVDLYTTSPDPTTAPDLPELDPQPADYYVYVGFSSGSAMQLIQVGPGGWSARHQVIEAAVAYTTPDQNTVTYDIPLAHIGAPASIRARAWQGGTRDPESHRIVDVVPDNGVVSIGEGGTSDGGGTGGSGGGGGTGGGAGGGSGAGTTPASSTAGPGFGPSTAFSLVGPRKVTVKGAAATFVVKNANSFPVSGTLSLVSSGSLAAKTSAQRTILGRQAFTAAAGRTVAVRIKLSGKGRKTLVRRGRLKAIEVAAIRNPSGVHRSVSRTVTLVLAKAKTGST